MYQRIIEETFLQRKTPEQKAAFRAWARNAPQKRPAPPGKRSYLDNFREAMELVCLEEAKEK